MSKILIAYYSRKGNNYAGGRIVNLPVGNTEIIAKKISVLTGGDLFEIKTVQSYPDDYTEATEVAKDELKENARPELSEKIDNLNSYEVIFLGYPSWWGTMPMPVFTFLESCDFSGKTIMPFCTHEGSGLGRSEQDIKKLCKNTNVLPGIAVRGSSVANADREVVYWLKKSGMIS